MAAGLAATAFANKVLDHMLRAQASTAPAANYVRPHKGDPGAAGTSNVPTTEHTPARAAATFTAASAGECHLTGTNPTWTTWSGENGASISYISIWDASSAGTFLYSVQLTTPKTVATGDTLTLTSLSVSLAPLAA